MKLLGLPIGISSTFWFLIGVIRAISERFSKRKKNRSRGRRLKLEDIAAIVPAHNEELVIRECIRSLKKVLQSKQVYVVSDGSSDKTYRRARMEGSHVSKLQPGRGKARAMIYLLNRFRLFKRYKLIFIIDADTMVDGKFIPNALEVLKDPEIGVVFGSPRILWPNHIIPNKKLYYVAYRDRLNRLLQIFYVFGQTWKYTNTNYVVPGFCTVYRSKVLKKLKLDTPGLLIEDFNLAFQLHRQKLGKIGHNFSLIAWDQYPNNLKDYWNQVLRWNIGFFQTVRKNGVWPSLFWLALLTFMLEVTLNALFTFSLPFLILFFIAKIVSSGSWLFSEYARLYMSIGPFQHISFRDLIFYLFVYDYAVTLIIGFAQKRPQYALYGLFFFFMHFVTSLILFSSIIPGFFQSSEGRWSSPSRRTL